MIEEIQHMMDGYVTWLRDKTSLREVGEWVEITTPLLDRNNDLLQIYVKRDGSNYILTDDGYTLDDLEQSGCKLDSQKRQDLLRVTLNGFGVRQHERALEVHATVDSFPLKKHSLLQAMLGVNDLFYLAKPHTSSLFYEDVVAWMEKSDIRFVENAKFTGKTGYDHLFDFVIPKSRTKPERIVRPINHPDKNSVRDFVFAWVDTRETRHPDSQAYAILNDAEQLIKTDVTEALASYSIKAVRWTERETIRMELAS
ncbi:DUF1829 domain-containing protein [Telmatobacter bradus]|uniref:DUF1829 domain-containing protein n=1 Tax=Telmatobacter bradus TaxID=474953 RepID=UPI003B432A77